MKKGLYMGKNTAVVDLSVQFYSSPEELVSSEGFRAFLQRYLQDLAVRNIDIYHWLTNSHDPDEIIPPLVTLAKQLLVLDIEEISSPLLNEVNRMRCLYVVEDSYNYWRSHKRFSILSSTASTVSYRNFIEADSRYNQVVITLYRTCEEKLMGMTNKVYRQLQSGTNASAVVRSYKWKVYSGYGALKSIPFIHRVMLRTPILFHTESNKRTGTFTELDTNPIRNFYFKPVEWFCVPLKVNDLLCFVYFNIEYMASGIAAANLFEMADQNECENHQPDLILLFGNQDDRDSCGFYYDRFNDCWIGSVSSDWKIEYFGYMKKAILTLHNLRKIQQGILPVHGSMLGIVFRDGTRKNVIMMGDSGAGKSESIEAIRRLSNLQHGNKTIRRIEVIFDDMGSIRLLDGHPVANGTETGAFVRLDDLDNASAYQDMERSIFINPERENARVILPVSPFEVVTTNHRIDMVLYANNYEEKTGVERFESETQALEVFTSGRRMAMGTTEETGLSSTFLANPFGPMQKPAESLEICQHIMHQLFAENIFVGQIYTRLGTSDKEKIADSAAELLNLLQNM